MITLTLLNPGGHGPLKNWQFANQSLIRIGRLKGNDIVLNRFNNVSRYHLELHQLPQLNHSLPNSSSQWWLVNKGKNGTFVDGNLTDQGLLRDNSLIQLGKDGPIFKFQIDSENVTVSPRKSQPKACNHSGNLPNNLFCIHCGQPIVESEKFISHYQILKTLGKGGMGTTYLALDTTETKILAPRLLVLKEMNADMAGIDKARELFEREASILSKLNHPGIPKYYDFFLENDRKYLAMELVHGQNLEHLILQTGPIAPQQAIDWGIQLCEILSYIHSLKPPVVHRDVKPANLMVRNLDNRLLLLDFGAVKELENMQEATRIGAEGGYMAPEQNRGQPCPQSDIYAVGPTLIFWLTGEVPLKYYSCVNDEFRFHTAKIPTITPQLGQVIERASAPKLRDRFSTAGELARALADCL